MLSTVLSNLLLLPQLLLAILLANLFLGNVAIAEIGAEWPDTVEM